MKMQKNINSRPPAPTGRMMSGRGRHRAGVGFFVLLVALGGMSNSAAADDAATSAGREAQLKSAFIYNFVQFTEWPASAFESAEAPIVIAVLGKDPVGAALERAVAGKKVGGRPVRVMYVGADEVGPCHALFISAAQSAGAARAMAQTSGKPVITIGEGDDFLASGGTIRLFTEDNKMRFEVSVGAAERAGLRVSSKLLRLARIYDERKK